MTIFRIHINKCKNGELPALKLLYNDSFQILLKVASRYALDPSSAKDILHDAYMKIFKKINQFEGDEKNLVSWMTKIVINEALQQLRKNKKITIEYNQIVHESEIQPEVMSNLFLEDLTKLIELLPKHLKMIFIMKEIDHLSHKEIADILEITPSHSRTRLTRAKAILQKIIIKRKIVAS